MHDNTAQARYAFIAITAAVFVWGLFHAIGAVRFNGNPWRGAVVMACSLGFLGFWWLMLAGRNRRISRGPHD